VARSGEVVVDRDVAEVGGPTRILARPVVAPTGEPLIVTVVGSTAPIARARHRLAVVLGIVWPVLVLVVAATAWILARAALRPVRRMTRRAETISLEGPDARLPQPPGSDEIAELGTTLNGMLERISETVAHERAFVDDASHELRSPIAVLRGELEMARLELTDGGDRALWVAAIDSAIEETDRLSRVTDRLLVLAHADAGRLADQLMPVRLLEATVREADRLHVDGVRIDVTGTEVEVMADPDLLAQLISNLLTNAARFADRRVLAEVGGDGAMLVVADDGPGFAPGFVDRALDRFSRGEPSRTRGRGGAGLGLAIVAAIADAFDGRIALANGGPLGGAVVGLDLPRAEPTG
jgi:signal transduction histidine kinase